MSSEPLTADETVVPFLDLAHSHGPLKPAILESIGRLIDDGAFTNGQQVASFEEEYSAYCGVDWCVGLASGLDALRLALVAAEIEQGDEVIVPAMTFIATFEAVTQAGGRPVPVDVRESDYCLDPDAASAAIGRRTRFVIPVDLYGQMADLRSIERVAAATNVQVIEDACQAHGASRDGVSAGGAGLAAAFSFYPAKNLGAFGDAGAIVTADEQLAQRVRAMREHGQRQKYRHEFEGYTARLDTIQALVLLHKLPLLDRWTIERRAAARLYSDALTGVGDLRLPPVPADSQPVWHLYVVRTDDPDRLGAHLGRHGIRTGRHYPEAVHRTTAYSWLGKGQGSFPVAEALAAETLSLPIFPGISEQQIACVVEAIDDYFRNG